MEFIIGGFINNPKSIIEKAINFFEEKYSIACEFEGVFKQNYFFGFIKEKTGRIYKNTEIFGENILFKSLFYHEVPNILKEAPEDINYTDIIVNLQNDFIFVKYDDIEGLNIYVDKFAREKIYYTISTPLIFSNSLKFLIFIIKSKRLNFNTLTRFLINGVIVGNETIFSNIKRLNIGEVLRIKKNKINISKYWDLNKDFFELVDHELTDFSYWMEYIHESLKKSVQMPSKLPVLALMSGGLDSTVITSILLKEYDIPVQALTIVVPNYNDEEGVKASEIAEFLKIPHLIKKTELKGIEYLENYFSDVFKIVEEPMGGTAFFSRYYAFKEIEKLDKQNILTGDGAGEVLSYLKDFAIKNYQYFMSLLYIPLTIRKSLMKLMQFLYRPTLGLTGLIKDKNLRNSFEILMNSNYLESNSQVQTFFSLWQYSNLKDISHITGVNVDLSKYYEPVLYNIQSYPFKDFNRVANHYMMNCINSDALINHDLASFFNLKLYNPYISDIAFQKILPIPPFIKTTGDRGKWIVRELAKKKNLLPLDYFDWKPKYGLRQHFFEEDSFEFVKLYILDIIKSLEPESIVNLKPFKKFFEKVTLNRISIHSSEYMKFNIWFGFLGWLTSI